MITLTESGLPSQEIYDAIADGSATYLRAEIVAHGIETTWEKLVATNLTGGRPVITDNYIIATQNGSPFEVRRFNLTTHTLDDGGIPFTSGNVGPLFWDGTTLYAFQISAGGVIDMNTSSDEGATWGTETTIVSAPASYTIKKIAPVSGTRIHFVAEHDAKKVQHLRYAEDDGGWSVTESDVYYIFPIDDMDAVTFDGKDIVVLNTEVVGNFSAENLDRDSNAELYFEQTSALIAFSVDTTNDKWGLHYEIDRTLPKGSAEAFDSVFITDINNKLYVTTYLRGSPYSYPNQNIYFYTSIDGMNYTFAQAMDAGDIGAAMPFLYQTPYIYAGLFDFQATAPGVYRLPATRMFGLDNDTYTEDISSYVIAHNYNVAEMQSHEFQIENASGDFDDHAFIKEFRQIEFDICAYYLYDGKSYSVPVGTVLMDTFNRNEDVASKTITIQARSVTRNLTDRVRSSDFYQLESAALFGLPQTPNIISHFATMHGSIYVNSSNRLASKSVSRNIAFLTTRRFMDAYEFKYNFNNTGSDHRKIIVFGVDAANYIGIRVDSGAVVYRQDDVQTTEETGLTFDDSVRVKYGLIESGSSQHIIDYSGLTLSTDKYIVGTNLPLGGSVGLQVTSDDDGTFWNFVLSQLERENITFDRMATWYASKADVLIDYQERIPPAIGSGTANVAADDEFEGTGGADANAFDGDEDTYVELLDLPVSTWNTLATTASGSYSSNDLLLAAEFSFPDTTFVYDLRFQYYDGTWNTFETYSAVAGQAQVWIVTTGVASITQHRVQINPASDVVDIRVHNFRSHDLKESTTGIPIYAGSDFELTYETTPTSQPAVHGIYGSEQGVGSNPQISTTDPDYIQIIGDSAWHTGERDIEMYTYDNAVRSFDSSFWADKNDYQQRLIFKFFPNVDPAGVEDDIGMALFVMNNAQQNWIFSKSIDAAYTFWAFDNFSKVVASNLYDSDAITLDPGETVFSGLQRAIEGIYVRLFTRFDNTFVLYEPEFKSPDFTIPAPNIFSINSQYRNYDLYSHARLLAANIEVDDREITLIKAVASSFIELNNPYITSESRASQEIDLQLRRLREFAKITVLETLLNPFVEPEDVISASGDDYIVNSITVDVQPGAIFVEYNLRDSIDV